jgi:hypothetical protein
VGIILDSSVIITAERRGHSVRQILEQVKASQGEIDIGLSVVTVAELVHGAYRAKTPEQQRGRLAFIEGYARTCPCIGSGKIITTGIEEVSMSHAATKQRRNDA